LRLTRAHRYCLHVSWTTRLLILAYVLMLAECAPAKQPRIDILPPNRLTVSRIIPSGVTRREPGCSIQTLDKRPGSFRDLGTIQLAGSVPKEADVFALINQKACEMGAEAIVIRHLEEHRGRDGVNYEVTVNALSSSGVAASATTTQEPSPMPSQ
jgi:hypothetical protein